MAAFSSIIGAIGVAAGIGGTVMQMQGARRAQKGEERAEQIRRSQMHLESQRERRNIVRQAMVARAQAVSSAESQGAMDGSGLAGGLAQVTAQGGRAVTAVNQNTDLGNQMFSANRMISSGNSMSAFGSGISSLGGALVNNSATLGRLGNYAFNNRA